MLERLLLNMLRNMSSASGWIWILGQRPPLWCGLRKLNPHTKFGRNVFKDLLHCWTASLLLRCGHKIWDCSPEKNVSISRFSICPKTTYSTVCLRRSDRALCSSYYRATKFTDCNTDNICFILPWTRSFANLQQVFITVTMTPKLPKPRWRSHFNPSHDFFLQRPIFLC